MVDPEQICLQVREPQPNSATQLLTSEVERPRAVVRPEGPDSSSPEDSLPDDLVILSPAFSGSSTSHDHSLLPSGGWRMGPLGRGYSRLVWTEFQPEGPAQSGGPSRRLVVPEPCPDSVSGLSLSFMHFLQKLKMYVLLFDSLQPHEAGNMHVSPSPQHTDVEPAPGGAPVTAHPAVCSRDVEPQTRNDTLSYFSGVRICGTGLTGHNWSTEGVEG